MDYLDYVNDDQRFPPARQVLADRSDPLQRFDEISFRDRFRMHKVNAVEIIPLLEPRLSSVTQRGQPIPVCLQVLITLRFLACGTFHRETGIYVVSVNQQTQANYKVLFYEYGNFPGVIGCIDGTHIPIKRPSTPDAEEYRNRKNWFP
ncbi:hypothetical protein H4Q32_031226 [Labeo rohita]|uniref:Nuclease HARBI1 n=1 Tax=Labeo rohita TaxID=84645 RepID=A0ABQ8L7F5_LABRO|nr:hypothetical protein H4Q32_031226 [Labeo rohita]